MTTGAKQLPHGDELMAVIDELAAVIIKMRPWLEREVGKLTAAQAAEVYIQTRVLNDAVGAAFKPLNAATQLLNGTIIPAAFEREGIKTLTSDRMGYRITVQDAIRAGVRKDMREKASAWLVDNDLADIITSTINASTLSALAKSLLEEGRELPEDYFNVALMKTTSMTKVKVKA
ncbi:hypothetical protein LCGC14_3130040 [marine sediment metagenome]|uniref:Uncharacterized protein n=1 Tax=marine sediment metagenome TaxID=412755 RepID=A0A0F8W004_9ZZZZ